MYNRNQLHSFCLQKYVTFFFSTEMHAQFIGTICIELVVVVWIALNGYIKTVIFNYSCKVHCSSVRYNCKIPCKFCSDSYKHCLRHTFGDCIWLFNGFIFFTCLYRIRENSICVDLGETPLYVVICCQRFEYEMSVNIKHATIQANWNQMKSPELFS